MTLRNISRFCLALLIIGLTACAAAEAEDTGRDTVAAPLETAAADQSETDRSDGAATRTLQLGSREETDDGAATRIEPVATDLVFPTTDIVIETVDGQRYPFAVEVAETPEQRRRGLMFRESLPENGGMLFLFDEPRIAAFWMKNTFVSLDMLFLTQDGRIADYHERAQPGKWKEDGYLAIIQSKVPVSAVLEVVAGTVDRLDLALGDRVRHPFFEVE